MKSPGASGLVCIYAVLIADGRGSLKLTASPATALTRPGRSRLEGNFLYGYRSGKIDFALRTTNRYGQVVREGSRHQHDVEFRMDTQLSPWWRRALMLLMATGFATLGYLAARTYRDAPPIPRRVVDPMSATLFTGQDIIAGQQVFLSHGLMENGTIWGHGAYLGPDFSAEYLHTLALDVRRSLSTSMNQDLGASQKNDARSLDAVAQTLKENRYESSSDTLKF